MTKTKSNGTGQEPYVSLEVVAEHFDVSEKTLRRWLADRKIPAIRVGRQIRLRLSDVEATFTRMGSESTVPLSPTARLKRLFSRKGRLPEVAGSPHDRLKEKLLS